ncbi:MAG: DnaB-like helicase C-terminal domain-containing protein, partial [bacterium]
HVISCILKKPDLIYEVKSKIYRNYFLNKHNKAIFVTIEYLSQKTDIDKLELDSSTLITILRRFNRLQKEVDKKFKDKKELVKYIETIRGLTVSPNNVEVHIEELVKAKITNELENKNNSFFEELERNYESLQVDEIINKAETNVLEIANKYINVDDNQPKLIGEGIVDEYANREYNSKGFVGYPSPFPVLDELTNGILRPGSVTLFNAKSGIGKSIILKNIVKRIGYDHKKPIYWGFNEMTKKEQKDRLLAEIIDDPKIDTRFISNGIYNKPGNEKYKKQVLSAAKSLEDTPIYFDQIRGYTPENLVQRARYFKKRYGIIGFVWDYVKKSSAYTGEKKQLRHWLGDVVNYMKEEIADPLNIFVVSAVQSKTYEDNLPAESADMWRQSTAFITLKRVDRKKSFNGEDYGLTVIKNRYGEEHDNKDEDWIPLILNKSKLLFEEII